jgi:hypothetical protein
MFYRSDSCVFVSCLFVCSLPPKSLTTHLLYTILFLPLGVFVFFIILMCYHSASSVFILFCLFLCYRHPHIYPSISSDFFFCNSVFMFLPSTCCDTLYLSYMLVFSFCHPHVLTIRIFCINLLFCQMVFLCFLPFPCFNHPHLVYLFFF